MRKQRDYKAEYARRVARGLEKGFTLSQARGHPRKEETHISRISIPGYDPHLEEGLKRIREGKSLRVAARSIHSGEDRFLRYLLKADVVKKEKGRWKLRPDNRIRQMPIYSRGREVKLSVRGYEESSKGGRYMNAVQQFLRTNDPAYLEPFAGDYMTDVNGKRHYFETRPNVLYRIDAMGPEPFEQVYKIVA